MMCNLWRHRGRVLLCLLLCLPIDLHLDIVQAASVAEVPTSLRTLSSGIRNLAIDIAPPIFCLDLGIELTFSSLDVANAMGSGMTSFAGSGCLRSAPMNAVIDHLKMSLRIYSLHAVDCVLEPMNAELSTIALLGIASVCSRSNMDIEKKREDWERKVKLQVESLFENKKRLLLDQMTGMVQRVLVSPSYELPDSGIGLPQFFLRDALMWSDREGEGHEPKEPTKDQDQMLFTHVQLDVKNDGNAPLHLYQLTLVEENDEHSVGEKTLSFVLPLATPKVVQPQKSDIVTFTAISSTAVDTSKSYTLYVSHSGFRSHVFEGVLDGRKFVVKEILNVPHDEDKLFDRFSLSLARRQSFSSSFPFAIWQVGSMVVALAVGLAVTLYVRRKRASVYLVKRLVISCIQRSQKASSHQAGDRTSSKPVVTCVTASQVVRGEDLIKTGSLTKVPVASSTPNASIKSAIAPSLRMPAISMKWKAPLPLLPRPDTPAIKNASVGAPEAHSTNKSILDLDRAARLHPSRFESMWDEFDESLRFQGELFDTGKHLDSDTLLENMKMHGISCMASGTVNDVEKYVFYAKQQGRSWFFLMTIDIVGATASTLITLRASSDTAEGLVLQLVELVKTTIAQSVATHIK